MKKYIREYTIKEGFCVVVKYMVQRNLKHENLKIHLQIDHHCNLVTIKITKKKNLFFG